MSVDEGGLALSSEWCTLRVFYGCLGTRTKPGGVDGGRDVTWLVMIGGRVELA